MKTLKQLVILLLALLLTIACSLGAPATSTTPYVSEPDATTQTDISAETGTAYTPPACAAPMCLTTSISLLDLQNNSLDENVVKLFSVAVDEERNLVYVAGIMTSNVAILDGATEEWVGIIQTGITERGIKYIYFDSAAQYLYIFESKHAALRRVNVTTGEIIGPVALDGGFGNLAFVNEIRTRL